jgi:hypothetical protein
MPDPTLSPVSNGATGAFLVAIASSIVGHQFGPIVTVIAAATVGALVSLGEVATSSRLEALRYVGTYVSMAIFLSGTFSWMVEHFTGLPAVEVLALVAFGVGWVGNRWAALRNALVAGASAFFNKKGSDQ